MDSRVSERLKIDRIHVAPRALELSPVAQKRFTHIWAPLHDLVAKLRALPSGLVRFWLDQPGGHVVITHQSSRYEPGEQPLKRQVLRNVAYVEASALAQDSLEALVPIGHLLDHLLGSSGTAEGLWLSEGGGVNPALREVGARIVELFALGYGFDGAACHDVHAYFARSLALYLQDRRALNAADPLVEKLLRTALLSQSFWRSRKIPAPGA
jgi:hypothetical protein